MSRTPHGRTFACPTESNSVPRHVPRIRLRPEIETAKQLVEPLLHHLGNQFSIELGKEAKDKVWKRVQQLKPDNWVKAVREDISLVVAELFKLKTSSSPINHDTIRETLEGSLSPASIEFFLLLSAIPCSTAAVERSFKLLLVFTRLGTSIKPEKLNRLLVISTEGADVPSEDFISCVIRRFHDMPTSRRHVNLTEAEFLEE
eukprot:TRINITY_DN408_c1_g1_i7.p1 TRINITY_DN408_c1_g1~~TRINITY_DN408_c1_g1_i7.p1  ORF type:complete len:202 (+),score=15.30 TRINITY_DN408_c1_g1_i7:401-1006(+)